MRLIILEEQWEFNNDLEQLHEIRETVNRAIERSGMAIASMKVNGHEILDQYYEFILANIADIHDIEVNLLSKDAMVNELIVTMEQYLGRALPFIERLSLGFYQNATAQVWEEFENFLEGISWIIDLMYSVERNTEREYEWRDCVELVKHIEGMLTELNEATENKDTLILGDIIKYEILPTLVKIHEMIRDRMARKVAGPHVN